MQAASTVKGLDIVGFDGAGIRITASGGGSHIQGNDIGIESDGTTVLGNSGGGIVADNSANNIIGGTTAADRNLITGNGSIFGATSTINLSASPLQVIAHSHYDITSQKNVNDLIVLDQSGTISFLKDNGDGTHAAPTTVATIPGAVAIAYTDSLTSFNSVTGGQGLVVADATAGDVKFLRNTGIGTFDGPQSLFSVSNPTDLAVQPVYSNTGTGTLIAVSTSDGNVETFTVRTNGTTAQQTLAAGTNPSSVAIATLGYDANYNNIDGIIATNEGSNDVTVFLQNPDGSFAAGTNFAVGTAPVDVAVEDVTKDNKPDLIVANSGSNNISILIAGSSVGSFLAARNFAVGASPSAVTTGDFDNDFQPDIAVANQGDNTVSVILRKPSGQLRTPVSVPVGSGPVDLISGSFSVLASDQGNYYGSELLVANGAGNSLSSLLLSNKPSDGVLITGAGATGNKVLGNNIGTTADGTAAPGNFGSGVRIDGASNNSIGGGILGGAGDNLISGNNRYGVSIEGDGATGNVVTGNRIGTNADGTSASPSLGVTLGNYLAGVHILRGGSNRISGNLISGNLKDGILIEGLLEYAGTTSTFHDAPNNVVTSNLVGTNLAGTASVPNAHWGINIQNANGTTVGGTTADARNVVSGNADHGIDLEGGTLYDFNTSTSTPVGGANSLIQGNYVGLTQDGQTGLGNGGEGIYLVDAPNNRILDNRIADNGDDGIALRTSNGVVIRGNRIGTNAAGTSAIGNGTDDTKLSAGIFVADSANVTVGGTSPGQGNLISGNIGRGLLISRPKTQNTQVLGNLIGTDVSGNNPLPNTLAGITIHNSASNNLIGGTTSGAGNVIAYNGGPGIEIVQGDMPDQYPDLPTDNALYQNLIYANGGAAITAPDSVGTNAPTMTKAEVLSGQTRLAASVIGAAGTTVRVEFYTQPATGTPTYLGASTVTLDSAGKGTATLVLDSALPVGTRVEATATATNPAANTSPFSDTLAVTQGTQPPIETTGADLKLQIVNHGPSTVQVSQQIVYTFVITNDGDADATGVILSVPLPDNVRVIDSGASQGSVSTSAVQTLARTFRAALGTIAPGGHAVVNLALVVTAAGPVSITGTVGQDGTEATPANNTATQTLTVLPASAPTITNLVRNGYHNQPAEFIVTFSGPLSPTSAQDLSNYTLIATGRGGQLGSAYDRVIPLQSAAYSPSSNAVILSAGRPLALRQYYGLMVRGNDNGLLSLSGTPIDGNADGQPGGDYFRRFGPEILILPHGRYHQTSRHVVPQGPARHWRMVHAQRLARASHA